MILTRRRIPPCAYCSESPVISVSMVCAICASIRCSMFQTTAPRTSPATIAEIAKYASEILNTVVRKSLPRAIAYHVSCTTYRLEERRVEAFVDLGAQPRNMNVNDIGLRIEMIVPYVFKQHRPRDHLPRIFHQ